jgi:hypothetical protein
MKGAEISNAAQVKSAFVTCRHVLGQQEQRQPRKNLKARVATQGLA